MIKYITILPKTPKPETPNGCSGIQWMSGLYGEKFPWEHCCEEHDWAYIEKSLTREEADLNLYNCVLNTGYTAEAKIIYTAVRLLGGLFWYT